MKKPPDDNRRRDLGDETGDESSPRPDENVAEEIGAEAGVPYGEGEPLDTTRKVAERDRRRWELDPASSEDYPERLRSERDERAEPGRVERGERPATPREGPGGP